MTYTEYDRIRINLKSKITRLKNKALKSTTLAEKITAQEKTRDATKELSEHRHNYFHLVPESIRGYKYLNGEI